jgi:peptidyl-prolyl cis-trans isomerase A (cyclophilin A)
MDWKISLLGYLVVAFAMAGSAMAQSKRKPGTYAIFETNQGTIVVELFPNDAPITVKNFVDLAEGNKEWKDPRTGETKKTRYFDGLVFHRVIPEFMIQGGDPTGTGTGGPGYRFQDEFKPNLKFDKPGRLAMANAGPGTNGSQFFITEVNTDFLNNKHTIFGQVVEGMDVVRKIARVPRDGNDKPRTPVVMQKVTIERVPGA